MPHAVAWPLVQYHNNHGRNPLKFFSGQSVCRKSGKNLVLNFGLKYLSVPPRLNRGKVPCVRYPLCKRAGAYIPYLMVPKVISGGSAPDLSTRAIQLRRGPSLLQLEIRVRSTLFTNPNNTLFGVGLYRQPFGIHSEDLCHFSLKPHAGSALESVVEAVHCGCQMV